MSSGKQREQLYAIVRVDLPVSSALASSAEWRNVVTVKGVLRSMEAAIAETERLNALNATKDCVYFWQATRVLGGPDAAERQHG